MGASFWAAVDARDALVDGDLQRVQERANYLAQQRFDGLSARWRYWVGQLQVAAGEAALAANTDEAAQWLAEVALACGNCHGYAKQTEPAPTRSPP